MTSVYVAGASSDLSAVDDWMSRLRTAGFAIALDWPANIRVVGDANPRHAAETDRLRWTLDDLEAAIASDVFWMIVPDGTTTGAWCELGAVWSYRRYVTRAPVIIVSGDWRKTIFTSLADHRFDSHEEAFAWIARA